jgi:hypothetical protein
MEEWICIIILFILKNYIMFLFFVGTTAFDELDLKLLIGYV